MSKLCPFNLHTLALAAALLCQGVVYAQSPPAPTQLPEGGKVVGGSAAISSTGNNLTVQQSSQRAAIDWNTFNVGSGAQVNFNQPSAAAVTLNRVLDNNPSQIMGRINAPGQVFIVNPNGVLFGATSQVDVGGLLVTTHGISNADFMAGKSSFEGNGKSGSIVNLGSLQAALGGYIALLAPQVRNEGVIIAREGTIAMAAGNKTTLVFSGQSLTALEIDEGVMDALVENKHLVKADGGLVVMTARSASVLMGSVVRNSGTVQAQTIANKGGRIMLMGDMTSGTTEVGGTLDASAPNGGDGGFIETSAGRVKIADEVRITTLADIGKTGNWLVDPPDFRVVANTGVAFANGDMTGSTLATQLASTNVELQSAAGRNSSGSGNVNISDRVEWSANTTLTLTATKDVNVSSNIVATGNTAGLVIRPKTTYTVGSVTHNADPKGTFNLLVGNYITLSGSNPTLSIAGQSYTVINSLGTYASTTAGTLQGIEGNLSGYFALGRDIDASATASWGSGAGFRPIGYGATGFSGIFQGLGHNITGLTVNPSGLTSVGLFGKITATANVSNVGLVGGTTSSANANNIGGLVGLNEGGTINTSFNTGTVSASNAAAGVGGLVGGNTPSLDTTVINISNSYATGNVSTGANSGAIGGLVGYSNGKISNSYAEGGVTAGANSGRNLDTDSNGVGGLAGYASGTVSNSYATGAVQVTGATSQVGGFIGLGKNLTLTNSYATGSVTVNGTGSHIGGFVGNNSSLSITNAFATGAVSAGPSSTFVGGFVGNANSAGTLIKNAYSSGRLTIGGNLGGGGFAGGVTGGASISNSFWNTDTLLIDNSPGVSGKTSLQLSASDILTTVGWHTERMTTDSASPLVWNKIPGQNNNFPVLAVGASVLYARAINGSSTYGSVGTLTYKVYNSQSGGSEAMGYVFTGTPVWNFGASPNTLTGSTIPAAKDAGTYSISYSSGLSFSNSTAIPIAGAASTWIVNPKPLGVTVTKTYDGNNSFTTGFQLSGMVPGQSAPSFTGSATIASKNVGTANAFLSSSLASANPNYVLTGTVSAEITKKTLTATVFFNDKTYDGNPAATPTVTIAGGLVGSETINATGTATFDSKNAGTRTATLNDVTLANGAGGGLAGNYDLSKNNVVPSVPGTTAVIKPKTIGKLDFYVADKAYDGTTTAATPIISLDKKDLVDNETLTVSGVAEFDITTIGKDRPVSLTNVRLGNGSNGGLASNYSLDTKLKPKTKAAINYPDVSRTPLNLNSAQLAVLTPSMIASLTPAQMASLSHAQIRLLTPLQLDSLSSRQLAMLSVDQFAAMTPEQLNILTSDALEKSTNNLPTASTTSLSTASPAGAAKAARTTALSNANLTVISSKQMSQLTPAQLQAISTATFSGLNPTQVASLTVEQFQLLSPSQLRSLSTAHITALNPEQLQALSSTQLNSLTPTQVSALKLSQVEALSPAQLTSLNEAQIASLTTSQLTALTPTTLSKLRESQLQALTANQMATLTNAQLTSLNKSQLQGLTANQFKALTPQQIAELPPAVFKDLVSSKIAYIKPQQLAALSESQMKMLSTSQITELTGEQLQALNNTQLNVLTSAQIQRLKSEQVQTLLPTQVATLSNDKLRVALKSLTTEQVQALTPQQIAKLAVTDVNSLNPLQLQSLSSVQIAAIAPELVAQLSRSQLRGLLPTQVAALELNQIAALSPRQQQALLVDQLALITPEQRKAFNNPLLVPQPITAADLSIAKTLNALNPSEVTPDKLTVLTPQQLRLVSDAQIKSWNKAQINALSPTQLQSLTSEQIASVSPSVLAGLDAKFVQNLQPSQVAVFTPAQLKALLPTQVQSLSPAVVASLRPEQINTLSAQQTSALLSAQVQALSKAQLQAMSQEQVSNLNPLQLATLSPAQLSVLTPDQISLLKVPQLQGLNQAQINGLTVAQTAALTKAQISALRPEQVLALNQAQVGSLSPAQVAALQVKQLQALQENQIAVLNFAQLDALSPAQLQALTPNQITALTPSLFGLLTKPQIEALTRTQFAVLPPQAIAAMGETQLNALNNAQVSAINAQQLAALSTSQLQAFTAAQLQAINPSQLVALSNTQLQSISPQQIGQLNPQQLNTVVRMLNPNQLTGLTQTQVSAMDMNQLRSLSPEQLQTLADRKMITLTTSR
jgi:filamentous hemagglutinin family protein